jgi:RNA polymerase sigma factor (sigma-70 family)
MAAPSARDDFATTQWSIVVRAGQPDDSRAGESLAQLCRTYWLPIYAYVRRRARDASEAQDLTQEFFARVLEKNLIATAAPERGKFRRFLLVSLKHFLINEHERATAQKRGGDRQFLALDWEDGERRMSLEPVDARDAEALFERQWALTALECALTRLREESSAAGKGEQFAALSPYLTGDTDQGYHEAATQLGITDGAARQIVSRLRKRYRELLRAEVAATLDADENVDEELERLFTALAS